MVKISNIITKLLGSVTNLRKRSIAAGLNFVSYGIMKVYFLVNWVIIIIYKKGIPFPKNFISVIKVIFKRLFRVYAHIYHSHF